MNYKQKRKLKLQIHKARRNSLYFLRNFANKENLEDDEEIEEYIKLTKEKFNDIITNIKNEIKDIEMKAKYSKNDKVRFKFNDEKEYKEEIIQVVYYNSVCEYPNIVYYDILTIDKKILYKHIKQDDIVK